MKAISRASLAFSVAPGVTLTTSLLRMPGGPLHLMTTVYVVPAHAHPVPSQVGEHHLVNVDDLGRVCSHYPSPSLYPVRLSWEAVSTFGANRTGHGGWFATEPKRKHRPGCCWTVCDCLWDCLCDRCGRITDCAITKKEER